MKSMFLPDLRVEKITCCECFVEFFCSDSHFDALKKTHKTFYCPNGHAQEFLEKTPLEQELEDAKENCRREREARMGAENFSSILKERLKRITEGKKDATKPKSKKAPKKK